VTCVKWKLVLVYLEIVILAQDTCKVCAECTMGMENFSGTPVGLLGDVGQVESRLSPFGDKANLDAR
jgi:ethanolamine utilization microcompartment shell protein EutS